MISDRNPEEVKKDIAKLKNIIRRLKPIFEEMDADDPFIDIGYEEVQTLGNKLEQLLLEYQSCLEEFAQGNVYLRIEEQEYSANPGQRARGESAPAYRTDINEDELYKLWNLKYSLNEIARRIGCSPDTVKRRIYKIEHSKKRGEKI